MRYWIFFILVFLSCNIYAKTVLHLKNGIEVEVNRWWEKDGQICYEKYGGTLCIGKDKIKEIKTEKEQKYFRYPTKIVKKEVKKEQQQPKKPDEVTEAKNYVKQQSLKALWYLELAKQYIKESIEVAEKARTNFYLNKARELLQSSISACEAARLVWKNTLNAVGPKVYRCVREEYEKYYKEVERVFGKQLQALSILEKAYMRQGYSEAVAKSLLRTMLGDLRKQYQQIQFTRLWLDPEWQKWVYGN